MANQKGIKRKTETKKSEAKYHRGEKIRKEKPKLNRKVVNKTFKTDEDLTGFIIHEGTYKDRVTAMALIGIKEKNPHVIKTLLDLCSEENGGDKAYLAITYAVKIATYYSECQKELENTKKEDKRITKILNPNREEEPTDIKEPEEFISFIEKIRFIKRFTDAINIQMSSPFLKQKLIILIRSLIEAQVLPVHMVNILMEHVDFSLLKETEKIISFLIAEKKTDLLNIIKEKIIQSVLYHKNPRKVQLGMSFVLCIPQKFWFSGGKEYKEYVIPLIRGYAQTLKSICDEINNPNVKTKQGFTALGPILSGILAFIQWEELVPKNELSSSPAQKFFKDHGYMIFKLAYHDNTKYSMQALTILETINEHSPINYIKVLADTIKKYTYMDEINRCEILNKAVNQSSIEVHSKVISSAYHAEIGGKYVQGCSMVIQECVPETKNRIGLLLLRKSYDKDIASTATAILTGQPIPIHNLWS
ncbi:hypothetical protein NEFER03_1926 [Nematocida sp. LUAm3]|nr:hypothetical protein NEFER03_1926 [Nematocida sp. LUAm3]KAI5176172.1 hypothetical protein NEFER02_1986 [Nematocida sp. LUAm2]KAI5179266.1 hypothetical protein NEFER01_2118 [Nematocida sp. LUAm1]